MSRTAEQLGHLKNHVKYPANRTQVLSACNEMSDWAKEDKEWVTKALPEGTYRAPEEVLSALLRTV
jgi:hypothetical protein